MLQNILKGLRIFDLFSGFKTNGGATGMLIIALLKFLNAPETIIQPLTDISLFVIAWGLSMKAVKKVEEKVK